MSLRWGSPWSAKCLCQIKLGKKDNVDMCLWFVNTISKIISEESHVTPASRCQYLSHAPAWVQIWFHMITITSRRLAYYRSQPKPASNKDRCQSINDFRLPTCLGNWSSDASGNASRTLPGPRCGDGPRWTGCLQRGQVVSEKRSWSMPCSAYCRLMAKSK